MVSCLSQSSSVYCAQLWASPQLRGNASIPKSFYKLEIHSDGCTQAMSILIKYLCCFFGYEVGHLGCTLLKDAKCISSSKLCKPSRLKDAKCISSSKLSKPSRLKVAKCNLVHWQSAARLKDAKCIKDQVSRMHSTSRLSDAKCI